MYKISAAPHITETNKGIHTRALALTNDKRSQAILMPLSIYGIFIILRQFTT